MNKPNKKIRVDFTTGEHFELGKLAPKTYEKICQETSEIKSKMLYHHQGGGANTLCMTKESNPPPGATTSDLSRPRSTKRSLMMS